MSSPVPEVLLDLTSRPFPHETQGSDPAQPNRKDHLDELLRALAIPFDLAVVQWRITEWSEDGKRGLMMPYADPRAYSDRLNDLFTPAGWSRKYAVQTSAPVQRSNRRLPAAKILVTCEVTIACIGTNSGTGEEWADKENALTAAEAQAFKRSLSCFGLGRYLYDIDGEWVDLDQGAPTKIPKLPRWATPNGWFAGLRPKPKRNRRVLARANGHSGNGAPEVQGHPGNSQDLVVAIEAMEHRIGKRLYRGLLKRVARVWTPQQIRETAVLEQVLAQMRGAERGLARLEAAQTRLAPEIVQKVVASLNAPPAKVGDLQTLHGLVVALEKEVEGQT